MKICYSNEKSQNARLSYFMAAVILVLGLLSSVHWPFSWDQRVGLPEFGTLWWFLSVIPYVLAAVYISACAYIMDKEARNHRNWHQYLAEHGVKSRGHVVEVIEKRSFRSGGRSTVSYQYRIRYFSTLRGEQAELITPILASRPDRNVYLTCDVYEIREAPEQMENDSTYRSGNSYHLTLNPVKVWGVLLKKSSKTWFGNAVADNFVPQTENAAGGKQ